MTGRFARSWEITKLSFNVIKQDKELLLFPILAGIFSLLFIIAMLFPALVSGIAANAIKGPITKALSFAVVFIIYLGLAFIATFFNVCVVYTTKVRFKGSDATFGESIRFALSRIHLIFLWSLLSATVGLLLHILDTLANNSKGGGRILLKILESILGAAWSIITIFVVPGMVYHNLGPIDAIKKSFEVLKKTWGESLIRYYGLGLAELVFIVAGIIGGFLLFFVAASIDGAAIVVVVILVVLYFLSVILVFSIANSIFNTALYEYASSGKIPKGYSADAMKQAFVRRSR